MSGFTYGEDEPSMTCGHCNGIARAEYVDIGVGFEQVTSFECTSCGAAYRCVDENSGILDWVPFGGPAFDDDYNGMTPEHWKAALLNDVAERFGRIPENLAAAGKLAGNSQAFSKTQPTTQLTETFGPP